MSNNHYNDPVGDALADKMHTLDEISHKLEGVEGIDEAEVMVWDCFNEHDGSLHTRCQIEMVLDAEHSIEHFANQLELMTKEARRIIEPKKQTTASEPVQLTEAIESVIATLNGNTYGLNESEQLEALRLACKLLEESTNQEKP